MKHKLICKYYIYLKNVKNNNNIVIFNFIIHKKKLKLQQIFYINY